MAAICVMIRNMMIHTSKQIVASALYVRARDVMTRNLMRSLKMSNDLDTLMNEDPMGLTLNDPKLDALIAHYRKQRANVEAGIKPKKERGPTVSLDSVLANLTKKPITPQNTIKRRV